jgi:uncharacterized membrane protein YjdF
MEHKNIGSYKFSINFNLGIVLLLVAIFAIMAFALSPKEGKEILVFSFAIIGGMGAIYTAYYAAQTLHWNLKRDIFRNHLNSLPTLTVLKFQSSVSFYHRICNTTKKRHNLTCIQRS